MNWSNFFLGEMIAFESNWVDNGRLGENESTGLSLVQNMSWNAIVNIQLEIWSGNVRAIGATFSVHQKSKSRF
jgi:hypothetical protein